ncbi:MAG TPA: hypothetical protein VGZ27_08460 [Vicinamibacterales bacterium]|jgi:hypothetical protein|nr:hypothetical protein [Vicinamibacterales bacterium]
MTNSALRFAALITIVLLLFPPPASAGWDDVWDYLDALSGPGPFTGNPGIPFYPICWDHDKAKVFTYLPDADSKYPCLYVDVRALSVGARAPYDAVTVKLIDAGATWHPYKFLDIGAGGGFNRFRSKDIITYRFSVTPLRVVVTPLATLTSSPRARALQYFVRETVMFGHLTGDNFGAPRGALNVGAEKLTSAGFLIDFSQLILGRTP